MTEAEKISIIEGPPPTFESTPEVWVYPLVEGPRLPLTAMCKLRTFNGPGLVERCVRAWRDSRPAFLDYRERDGLRREVEIVAARSGEVEEGHVLYLWVRLQPDEE